MNDDFFFDNLAAEEKSLADQAAHDERAAAAIYNDLFQEQKWVLDDPWRFKSVLTPRRAGKTHSAIAAGLHQCLTKPGSIVVIVTLTLRSAKRLYWEPILKASDKYGLNLRRPGGVHHTHAEARFENGSSLFLMGAETKAEIEKLRGGSYDLVILDECKSFTEHIFRELVEEILTFACSDREGTIILIGTPGPILAGPFYESTYPEYKAPGKPGEDPVPISRSFANPEPYWQEEGREPEWSRHTWTQQENTAIPNLWEDTLRRKKQKRWSDDNPAWIREALGQWVSTGDAMVYAYSRILTADREAETPRCVYRRGSGEGFNRWGLPEAHEWRYVLGMDLGFEDDTAIVVVAYSPTVDTMYVVYEFKEKHMIISQLNSQLQHIQALFGGNIEAMVADTGSGGKLLVESINQMYGHFLVKAEKNSKNDFIELLNSDLYDGKLKVLSDGELASEWLQLQWDLKDSTKELLTRGGKLTELRSCDNHLSDAVLYTWRFCLHHFSRDKVTEPEPQSQEWFEDYDYAEAVAAVKRREQGLLDEGFYGTEEDLPAEFDQDTSWIL